MSWGSHFFETMSIAFYFLLKYKISLEQIFLARCSKHIIRLDFHVCGQVALKFSSSTVLVGLRHTHYPSIVATFFQFN